MRRLMDDWCDPKLVCFNSYSGYRVKCAPRHMPLSTPEWWWHTSTGVLALPMSAVRRYGAETAAVFAVAALLGALWAGVDVYLPW